MKINIRLIYLYLFSFIGLLISVMGTTKLVDLGLRVYIFKGADVERYFPVPLPEEGKEINKEETDRIFKENAKSSKQRDASNAISMIIVGLPLYLYHWKVIQKEK